MAEWRLDERRNRRSQKEMKKNHLFLSVWFKFGIYLALGIGKRRLHHIFYKIWLVTSWPISSHCIYWRIDRQTSTCWWKPGAKTKTAKTTSKFRRRSFFRTKKSKILFWYNLESYGGAHLKFSLKVVINSPFKMWHNFANTHLNCDKKFNIP